MSESRAPVNFERHAVRGVVNLLFGEGKVKPGIHWLAFAGISMAGLAVIWQLQILGIFFIVGGVIAGPFVVSALWNTKIGLYIMVSFGFFLSVINRLYEHIPMGIAIDLMIVIMLSGVLYRAAEKKDWSMFSSPMSIAIVMWGAMNIFELFNPWAGSRAAWFYVIRPAVGYMMLFFITYSMIRNKRDLFQLLYVIFFFCMLTAAWGIYQVYFGYFDWEMAYVIRHDTLHLVFNNGRLRAIGSIGSPAQYGIIMGCMSMMTFFLSASFQKWWSKGLLWVVGFACLLAMVYSGTRSAYVILPISYFMLVIISRKRSLYYSLIVAGVFLTMIAVTPSNNYHIQRIQSVFNASEDASYQTRAKNKQIIFPWILKHPIGGGLGSTGVWGQRFSPGTFLANFPPDSGLIRVAVELGWIGLIFFLMVYYRILVSGTFSYWKMKDPKLKAVVSSMICITLPMLVVEWGQEVVGVFPMSILFWILNAIMFRAIDLDQEAQQSKSTLALEKHTNEG